MKYDRETIIRKRGDVITHFGPWLNHSIHIVDDLYTEPTDARARRHGWDDLVLRRVVQTVADLDGGELRGKRVLDLGALEGLYSVEFARQGAYVTAVDVRQEHIEKINFIKDILGLDNLETICCDVRELTQHISGTYDYILCLGLLYHLEAEQAHKLITDMQAICTRACIIDTHISLHPKYQVSVAGVEFSGAEFVEQAEHENELLLREKMTASVGNRKSFWFTKASLMNLLCLAGFTSAHEIHKPESRGKQHKDRVSIIAIKGSRVSLLSTPENNKLSDVSISSELERINPIINPINHPPLNTKQKILNKLSYIKRSLIRKSLKKKATFDKYEKEGAYHWAMLQTDASYRARVCLVVSYLDINSKCLDLGCGDGAYMEVLAPQCSEIIGVDSESTGVALAKELLQAKGRGNAEVRCTTFENVSSSKDLEKRFDVIYAMDVIEHLEEPSSLVRAIRHTANDKATILIGTPEFVSLEEVSPYHCLEYTEEQFLQTLQREFDVEEIRRLPAPLRSTGHISPQRFMVAICRLKKAS